jgi:hypothetical protein
MESELSDIEVIHQFHKHLTFERFFKRINHKKLQTSMNGFTPNQKSAYEEFEKAGHCFYVTDKDLVMREFDWLWLSYALYVCLTEQEKTVFYIAENRSDRDRLRVMFKTLYAGVKMRKKPVMEFTSRTAGLSSIKFENKSICKFVCESEVSSSIRGISVDWLIFCDFAYYSNPFETLQVVTPSLKTGSTDQFIIYTEDSDSDLFLDGYDKAKLNSTFNIKEF